MTKLIKLAGLVMMVAICVAACSEKKPTKTIDNLKAAISGETNAAATYKAFSEKAKEDCYPNIAVMFAAAAEAELIHVKNHNDVLVALGQEPFNPTPDAPTINELMADNINAAIEGETYEFSIMYPDFIISAENEKINDAFTSFNWAMEAEKMHAVLYSKVLQILLGTECDSTVAPE